MSEDFDAMNIVVRASRDKETIVSEYCPCRPYLEIQIPPNVAQVVSISATLVYRDQGMICSIFCALVLIRRHRHM